MLKRSRKINRKQDEETSYWLSYSDMMAGLLLIFVLIIGVTMLRAQVQYDLKQQELLGKEEQLMVQTDELEQERETVASQQLLLDEQKEALGLQEEKLIAQQEKLATQEEELRAQHILLSELENLMASQQAKLDQIIGVRRELVEKLKKEFANSDLQIAVDEQTGAITFQSSILFEFNHSELKPGGKEFLAEFLPRYVKILLGPEYRKYISEISIEGNTDTNGDYLYNLELSQKRALSVAEYCLSDEGKVLSGDELEALRSVVVTSGRSYSNPVYNANGEVDMEASRRVDFLFRLKDEEMIREMIEILNTDQAAGTAQTAETGGTEETAQAE